MRAAIREALLRDERVFLMGEDVGRYGGCFAGQQGSSARIGPERIRRTPLSESAFVGVASARPWSARADRRDHDREFQLLRRSIVNNAATNSTVRWTVPHPDSAIA